jgi:hypothetical protein
VSARLYRGTWLLLGLPLLVAAFSVDRPAPLPPAPLPPSFDGATARALAEELAEHYPDRSPGSPGARGASDWLREQLRPLALRVSTDSFEERIPGVGRVRLENILGVVAGRSRRALLVIAHRDDAGTGPGANDNGSGTGVLVELARAYASPAPPSATTLERVGPAFTILFLSTDGGAFGSLGAARFAARSPYRDRIVAVLNLDAVGGRDRARLHLAADAPRSPAPTFVQTVATRVLEQTREEPLRPSALEQLLDLAFPFSLYEQAPFVARNIPAVTLSTAGDRPPPSLDDDPRRLTQASLTRLGRAAEATLSSLDQGLEVPQGASSSIYLGARVVPGWAVQLVLIAAVLPFMFAAVDLFARCRRRRISLAPAWRSYRSRLGFWLWAGGACAAFMLLGAFPDGAPRPLAPESDAAGDWATATLLGLAGVAALGWLVTRERLVPRRPIRPEEELAGHTAALIALSVVALLVISTNPFALVFVLPSLHAWLWLPQLGGSVWLRLVVLAAGFAGPLFLVVSFGARFGVGFDAPWYLATLLAVGYVPATAALIALPWLAAAGQLTALTVGRYAPYPTARERRPRGPIRATLAGLLRALRSRHTESRKLHQALEG